MTDMPIDVAKCLTHVIEWLEANERQEQADILRYGIREVEIRCYPEGCFHTYADRRTGYDELYDETLYTIDYPVAK